MWVGHDLRKAQVKLVSADDQPQHKRLEELLCWQREERRQLVLVSYLPHHLKWLSEVCLCMTVTTLRGTLSTALGCFGVHPFVISEQDEF